MAFDWMQPTLMVFHRPLALFLAWNDESGEVMFMNSDKLEWAWNPLEFVGTTTVGTYPTVGDAAAAMSGFVARIEQGDYVVIRHDPEGRDVRRWDGTEWIDPLESPSVDPMESFRLWRDRCAALGGLTPTEVTRLIDSLRTSE